MKLVDEKLAPYGVLVLRVGLGVVYISHALLKWFVFTIPGLATWLGTQGLPPALAWPLFIMELVGGVAIVLGIYGRYVALLLTPILLVAAAIHFPNGWVHTSQGGGWEYPVFLIVASFAYALIGDGALALQSRRELIPRKV
jgi:putative oxidoreductase